MTLLDTAMGTWGTTRVAFWGIHQDSGMTVLSPAWGWAKSFIVTSWLLDLWMNHVTLVFGKHLQGRTDIAETMLRKRPCFLGKCPLGDKLF